MKYRIYVDEVGNPDLESAENPNHRFLSLTGVIMELEYVDVFAHPKLEELKRKYFHTHADEPIILHRKELLSGNSPFEVLKDPRVREEFNVELLDYLNRLEFTVITVCLDKRNHKETYSTWRYHPYHYCLMMMLERFTFFLNRHDAKGDVLAESRGGKEDRKLKDSFRRLVDHGNDFVSPEQFAWALTSKELKVKPKANNICGLQIADLVAHPSRNEILFEKGLIDSPAPFARRILEILQSKYDQLNGRVYGKKYI